MILTFERVFMPAMVEIRQRGGIDLIICKCFATVSVVGAPMFGISTSLTLLSNKGFDAMIFILSRLQILMRIFISGSDWL